MEYSMPKEYNDQINKIKIYFIFYFIFNSFLILAFIMKKTIQRRQEKTLVTEKSSHTRETKNSSNNSKKKKGVDKKQNIKERIKKPEKYLLAVFLKISGVKHKIKTNKN